MLNVLTNIMSDVVAHRKCRFLSKFIVSDNMLCQVVKDVAMDELTLLNRAVCCFLVKLLFLFFFSCHLLTNKVVFKKK